NPGVNGPTRTPANKYPATGEIRRRWAIVPMKKDATKPITIVAISGVWCGIQVSRRCGTPQARARMRYSAGNRQAKNDALLRGHQKATAAMHTRNASRCPGSDRRLT